ncbi:WbqC-like protein [Nocardiopsis sp. Huas11]|uniref:WbqC family protein n=1 Tax=Nocardiopsis sp. Huas11 TaxID=2183912 RepID=UPI000EACC5C4|nr:WbqC family protein [Nocardiopsis sp. Huas11]RKS07036.1 WbqC-like protein [Nocardiopsis sp. Huas11]
MSGRPAVLVAHQPAYLPWGGYFSRLLDVDELVLLDHVQFVERGPQRRNVIRAPRGGPLRLTVPVLRGFGQPINRVRIAEGPWAARHWRSITDSYRRAPYWELYAESLHEIYHRPWTRLAELNTALIHLVLEALGMRVTLTSSSRLRPRDTRTQMLLDLARMKGATRLRVGPSGPSYLDRDLIARAGVDVEVATYTPPIYRQGRGDFTPGLAALGTLMWTGPAARELLADASVVRPLEEVVNPCGSRPTA